MPDDPRCDGLLVQVGEHEAVRERLLGLGLPVVYLERRAGGGWVGSDEWACGGAAAAELAAVGIRRVWSAGGGGSAEGGFAEAAERLGMEYESLPEVERRGDPMVVAGLLAGLLAGVPKPCGFFYPEATVAVSLTDELERMGVRVPEDVAVVVIGEEVDRTCELAPVPLTAVMPDEWRVGFEAARMLHGMLCGGGREPDGRLVSPAGICRRASSGRGGGGDPVVRKALELIAGGQGAMLRIAELAALLSVCRRVLEMRFRSETGVTLHRALTDRRMAVARRLLVGTPLRMGVIAERCGYSSAAYFTTAFHREAGVTPAEWRRQQPRG